MTATVAGRGPGRDHGAPNAGADDTDPATDTAAAPGGAAGLDGGAEPGTNDNGTDPSDGTRLDRDTPAGTHATDTDPGDTTSLDGPAEPRTNDSGTDPSHGTRVGGGVPPGTGRDAGAGTGSGSSGTSDARVAAAAVGAGGQRRRVAFGVLGALVVAFALRLAIGLTDDAPASDETAYLQSGASLVAGDGFDRDGRPELHFPPLVPFVSGLAAEVTGDPHAGSVAVTVLAGTAAVLPLAAVARRVAGPRAGPAAGVATAWLAAVVPGLATLPSTRGTGSEATYVLVVASALALALHVPGATGRRRLALAAAAGLAVGLAYLTRPEGLFLGLPLAVAVAWPARLPATAPTATAPAGEPAGGRARAAAWAARARRGGRVTAASLALFAVPIAACVVPYAAFLHTHTGEWQLTAKTQDASLEAWHAVARGDRLERDRILYALDDSGLRFAAGRAPLTELAEDDPGGYLAIVGTNVATLATTAAGWSLVPLPLTALAAWAAWRHRRSWRLAVVLAVGALPVATAVAFFVQPRYLVVTAAVVVVAAGVGLAALPGRWRLRAGVALLALAAAGSVTAFHGPAGWGRPADFTDQRLAGEWVAAHAEPGARVVTRSMVVDFYADRPTVALPDADLDGALRFARHYGAAYLVADSAHIERFRPQLAFLLDDDLDSRGVDGLRLVHEVTAEGRTTRVFALDPAPPPSDAEPPALGFMGDGAG